VDRLGSRWLGARSCLSCPDSFSDHASESFGGELIVIIVFSFLFTLPSVRFTGRGSRCGVEVGVVVVAILGRLAENQGDLWWSWWWPGTFRPPSSNRRFFQNGGRSDGPAGRLEVGRLPRFEIFSLFADGRKVGFDRDVVGCQLLGGGLLCSSPLFHVVVEVGLFLTPLPVGSLDEGEDIIKPGNLEASLVVGHGGHHIFLHDLPPDIRGELLRIVGGPHQLCLNPFVGRRGVGLLLGVQVWHYLAEDLVVALDLDDLEVSSIELVTQGSLEFPELSVGLSLLLN